MFGSIAGRYDRANTILSGGVHHRWRRKTVRWSGAKRGDRVLDCATGTGDLAIAFKRAVGEEGVVVGTDFTPEMLDLARAKTKQIEFDLADVMHLPYRDASFDISSIAFGIRNVADPRTGVRELARVVKSGGRVMILDLGSPPNGAFRRIYDFYRRHILPKVGGIVTGEQHAYEYLERSSSEFPCGDRFVQLMRESAAFQSIEYERLMFGIAYVYRGVKL
jgi:demethylmenaquinone methyltransferase/2-methoxy-6-polyprenyl-1,4-benzoquinol methylase